METILPYDCGICFGDFRLPVKVLNCGHSFCGPCLAPFGRQGQVQCQICHFVTFLTAHGVAGLTNNLTVHTLIRKTRPADKILIDYTLLGPPPRAPQVAQTAQRAPLLVSPIPSTNGSSVMFDSRPSTPQMPSSPAWAAPPTLAPAFLLPVECGTTGLSPISPSKSINVPPKSCIRTVDQGASILVGDQSFVVTGETSSLFTGAECKIFSHQPVLPTFTATQTIQGYNQVNVGYQSQVQTANRCVVTVGNRCEIWLANGSNLMSAGPNCVLHTAVQQEGNVYSY